MVRVENVEGGRNVYFDAFPSGSVIAFKVSLFSSVKEAVTNVRSVYDLFINFLSLFYKVVLVNKERHQSPVILP